MKSVLMQILVICVSIVICSAFSRTESLTRVKRQNPGDAFIDAVFQVPIQTLSAVGTLVKTSRPVIMNVRRRIIQSLTPPQQNGQRPQRYLPQQVAGDRVSAANYGGFPNSVFNKLQNQPHRFSFQHPNQAQRFTPTSNKLFKEG